jgi:hypothetical protein
MKYTLRNGATLEGTPDQIVAVARSLGETVNFDDGLHYLSATRGLMLIRDMDLNHLRNALVKRYAAFVATLESKNGKTHAQVCSEIQSPSDKTLVGLMAELTRRGRNGNL